VCGGIKIDAVDDVLQELVLLRNVAQMGGELFADSIGELANDRLDRLLCGFRHQRQVETHQLVVGLDQPEGLLA